jgi:hypothetical protein
MRCNAFMVSKLHSVRDMRLRVAEMALASSERDLADRHKAEAQAQQALAETVERSAAEEKMANVKLVRRAAGGRLGISQWTADRKKAQAAVRSAHTVVHQAASDRADQESECARVRLQWRDARFGVERLGLLVEELGKNTR